MGLNLDSIYNNIANSISFNSIFNDPIRTSLIIILIILIFIYFMFRTEYNDDSDYSFNTLLFRTGFYLTLPIMTIMFIHYKNIEREYDHKYDNKALTSVINSTVTGKGENLLEFHKEINDTKIQNNIKIDKINENGKPKTDNANLDNIKTDNIDNTKTDEIISDASKRVRTTNIKV